MNFLINEQQVLIVTFLFKELLFNIMKSSLHPKYKIIAMIL